MGVEVRETGVEPSAFAEMERFVREYLVASVESEEDGGRMRWYPWHSAEYRFNHIRNVVDIGEHIAREEGADVDVVRVAALFHDVAKLEADQDVHAEEGARVAREFLESRGEYAPSFVDEVVDAVADHSYQGPVTDLSLEKQCLIEADLLDKIGANGTALMLLRMGYESRTHMDAATMVERVYQRGKRHASRVESETGEAVAHRRLKRVRWFREWLEDEVTAMEIDESEVRSN
ncbi:HD domain-containing protein [Halobaculum sp. MBLA0147]|uniref:HD domain-containing protein n=1 Tax=Halobaculum sp. MBLA0147 TaxID=3079934 RepID=UPI003523A71D